MDTVIVEITKFNPVKGIKASSRERTFRDYEEFKRYYDLAKKEKNTIINIRFYDAIKYPMKATKCDYIIQKYNGVPCTVLGKL